MWDKYTKPHANVCPEKYCFHWMSVFGMIDQPDVVRGHCECEFGACARLHPVGCNHDWYEPCEPALAKDGLPWFYFIPSTDKLVAELHEQYLRESIALWGNQSRDI